MVKKIWLRASLFLVITILFQGMRLIIPLPPFFSMFLIGSLVNMALALSVLYCGRRAAVMIGCLVPVAAFFQGQLVIFLLIPLVAAANIIWIILIDLGWDKGRVIWIAPFIKMLFLYGGVLCVIGMMQITGKMAMMISFMMSWPQLVTGIVGLFLTMYMVEKIPFSRC